MIQAGKMLKRRSLWRDLFVMLTCFALMSATFIPVVTAEATAQTEMKHNPPGYFIPEHRIQLDARISDPTGVDLARCYFRAGGEADFVFVPMTNTGGDDFSGILPAPSPTTDQIEYLFLSVNTETEVVKSQTFVLNMEETDETPPWQEISKEEEIRVSMELDQVPAELEGFTDNIVMDKVESGLRFGVVVGGLYHLTATKTAGTSGAAASASSAGTITAGTGGLSTAAIVGIGAAGAAAAVGGAAVVGSSSDGGGGSSNGNRIDDDTKATDLVGAYYVTEKNTSESAWHADVTLSSGGSVSFTEYSNGDAMPGSGSWSYTPSARYLSMQVAGSEGSMSGSIEGNVKDFWISGTWGDGSPAYFRAIRR